MSTKPKQLLTATTFANQLLELKNLPLTTKILRGNPSIDQTERNILRRELLHGLFELFNQTLGDSCGVYDLGKEGIAIEVENQSVIESNANDTGFLTLVVNVEMKNLAFDANLEAELVSEEEKGSDDSLQS